MKAFFVAIICGGIGWGIYMVGTNVASDKIVDTLSTELESSGELEKVIQEIEMDPALQEFVQDAQNVDESTLPFTTKEEATRAIIKKVGISELMNIQQQVTTGSMTQEEVISVLEENLTEEEILALKVIAYKELQNQ